MKYLQKITLALALFVSLITNSMAQIVIIDVNSIINTDNPYVPCSGTIVKKMYSTNFQLGNSSSISVSKDCPTSNGQLVCYWISIPALFPNTQCDGFGLQFDCKGNMSVIRPFGCKDAIIITSAASGNTAILTFGGYSITLDKSIGPKGSTQFSLASTPSTTFNICETKFDVLYNPCGESSGSGDNINIVDSRIQSSPNPTTGIVNLWFEGVKEGNANIQVYNNIGNLVQEISTISVYEGENSQQIDLGSLPAGLYNIAIRQGEQIRTQRIQKL